MRRVCFHFSMQFRSLRANQRPGLEATGTWARAATGIADPPLRVPDPLLADRDLQLLLRGAGERCKPTTTVSTRPTRDTHGVAGPVAGLCVKPTAQAHRPRAATVQLCSTPALPRGDEDPPQVGGQALDKAREETARQARPFSRGVALWAFERRPISTAGTRCAWCCAAERRVLREAAARPRLRGRGPPRRLVMNASGGRRS